MAGMDPHALRAFAQRNRSEVERLKLGHTADLHRRGGSDATVRVARALFEHARRLRPGFPGERELAADLDHHVRLKRRIDQASRVVAVR